MEQGHLRAAHTDREQVIAVLKTAFVQGRLDKDELVARVGQAFASRTYADLAALTHDIPAAHADTVPADTVPADTVPADTVPADTVPADTVPADTVPADTVPAGAGPSPGPARTLAKAVRRAGVCMLVAAVLLSLSVGLPVLILLAFVAFMAASGFVGYGIVDAWQQRRPPDVPARTALGRTAAP
jgi:hypothetical protein